MRARVGGDGRKTSCDAQRDSGKRTRDSGKRERERTGQKGKITITEPVQLSQESSGLVPAQISPFLRLVLCPVCGRAVRRARGNPGRFGWAQSAGE